VERDVAEVPMSVPADLALVLEAFDRNARVNRATLTTLTMPLLELDDAKGGFSIGQHLADTVSFRREWLSHIAPEHAERIPSAIDMKASTWLAATSIDELQSAFDVGDAAIRDAVVLAVEEGRRFQGVYESHPAQLLVHCIVHDAHHRGQIMALLRQHGRSADERERLEQATWPIWRE
jgi:uncharacterized damage-inducible protein DinB